MNREELKARLEQERDKMIGRVEQYKVFDQPQDVVVALKVGHDSLLPTVLMLAEALLKLRNEASGLIYAHRAALEMDGGNTNLECIRVRIAEADAALAKLGGEDGCKHRFVNKRHVHEPASSISICEKCGLKAP